jgi:hypothetical protein
MEPGQEKSRQKFFIAEISGHVAPEVDQLTRRRILPVPTNLVAARIL